MLYIKELADFNEIANGDRITIDLGSHGINCVCPGCGTDFEAPPFEVVDKLIPHKGWDAVYCAECSAKLLEAHDAANAAGTRAEALGKWVPDDKRDKLMAMSVLWSDYRNLANALGEDHIATLEARRLLERVMDGPLCKFRDEVQVSVLTAWESFDRSVEDAAEGNEELAAFYRRVLGLNEEEN